MQLGDFPSGRSSPQQPPSSPGLSSDPYPTTTKCPWMRCTHVATLVPTRMCLLPPCPAPSPSFSLSHTHTLSHLFTHMHSRSMTVGPARRGSVAPSPSRLQPDHHSSSWPGGDRTGALPSFPGEPHPTLSKWGVGPLSQECAQGTPQAARLGLNIDSDPLDKAAGSSVLYPGRSPPLSTPKSAPLGRVASLCSAIQIGNTHIHTCTRMHIPHAQTRAHKHTHVLTPHACKHHTCAHAHATHISHNAHPHVFTHHTHRHTHVQTPHRTGRQHAYALTPPTHANTPHTGTPHMSSTHVPPF